jgi:hypothetical protein
MTKTETIATLVQTLAESMRAPLTPAAIRGYLMALDDLDAAEVNAGVSQALRSPRAFMPTPGELRALCRPEMPIAARAAQAWEAVRKAIRRHDYTVASIDFGPLVNTVLRSMGPWEWLCEQSDDDMVWRAKDFERFFEAFATGPVEALRPEPLTGWGAGRAGCDHVRVAIGGVAPPLALPAKASPVSDLVRELADAKAAK